MVLVATAVCSLVGAVGMPTRAGEGSFNLLDGTTVVPLGMVCAVFLFALHTIWKIATHQGTVVNKLDAITKDLSDVKNQQAHLNAQNIEQTVKLRAIEKDISSSDKRIEHIENKLEGRHHG